MRDLVTICVVLTVALGPAHVWAQQPPVQAESTVVMSGEGVVFAAPDRAWVTISAESRAAKPRDAQRRNADAMRPVQDALRAAKIPADAIRTIGYDLQQEWDFVQERRVSRGYVARNAIEVRVDDTSRVGELLELAVGSGATSGSGVRFDLKDRGALEREALRLAVSNACGRAEAAAAGAGRTLDRVLRIEEQGASTPVPMLTMRAMAQDAGAGDAPPIASGQIEIRAGATVAFTLK